VRLRRGSPDPNWPLRRNFVLLSVVAFVPLFGPFIVREAAVVLFAFAFAGIALLPHLAYLLVVRSRIGSIVIGLLLLVATAGSIGWLLSIAIDDGLEGLVIPATTWLTGSIAIAVERTASLIAVQKRNGPLPGTRVD
jgi:hypothetical protein